MATDLCSPDILVHLDQSVDAVILELFDDAHVDIENSLVVLAADRLNTGPVDTYKIFFWFWGVRTKSKKWMNGKTKNRKRREIAHTYPSERC